MVSLRSESENDLRSENLRSVKVYYLYNNFLYCLGDLATYIQVYQDTLIRSGRAFKRCLDMAMGICDAMVYLESRYIIHRDLGTFFLYA